MQDLVERDRLKRPDEATPEMRLLVLCFKDLHAIVDRPVALRLRYFYHKTRLTGTDIIPLIRRNYGLFYPLTSFRHSDFRPVANSSATEAMLLSSTSWGQRRKKKLRAPKNERSS